MKALRLLALALVLPGFAAAAEIEFDPQASVSLPTLEVPVGVRATGMGEAYTAVGDDVYALHWNPAGLADMHDLELGLSETQWDASLGEQQDLVTYGQGVGLASGAAISADYFNLGDLEQRDENGNLLGSSSASVLEGSVGYGSSLLFKSLRAGVSLEFAQQSLYGVDQAGFGGGFGLLYDPLPRLVPGLTAGLAFNNLGVGLEGFKLPSTTQGGLALRLPDRNLILSVEAEAPFNSEPVLKAGFELGVNVLYLRAGYRQALGGNDVDEQSGFSAGVGFEQGPLRLDYSYTPYGDLSTVQRFEITVALPKDFFAPRVIYEEGTSGTAQAYFKQAQDLEAGGDNLRALIRYELCLDNYPDRLKAQPQAFYLEAVKQESLLETSLSQGGNEAQIHELTKESLNAAGQSMRAGHFKMAIVRLQQALRLDPQDQDLAKALKDDQNVLQGKLASARDAAHFGTKEGDLAMAVENYQALLALEPDDREALAFMTRNRDDLRALLQSMDRKASYFYVAGQMEEAIKVWSDGEALNYFGDVDFVRNLEKARKQLELLQQ
jgi:tetratricopeptide (TPR) repeat protein